MEEEKKYEQDLKKYKNNSETAKKIVNRMDMANREMYKEFEDLVVSEDGKEVDLKKYKDDKDLQEKAVQNMKKTGLKYAKTALSANPANKYEEELLMDACGMATETALRKIVMTHKHKLSFELFKQMYDQQMKPRVASLLKKAAGGHLTEDHVKGIIKYSVEPEVYEYLGAYHENFNLDEAIAHLDERIKLKKKLGLNDILRMNQEYASDHRGQPLLHPTLVDKIEDATEKKQKKEEEEAEKRTAA